MKKEMKYDFDLQFFAEDKDDEDQTDNSGDMNEKEDNVSEDKTDSKSFSQEQVTKMMAKEKKQGRNAILKELGINPNDEKAIEGLKNLIASQKSEEQKNLEKEVETNRLIEEANKRVALAEAKAEAMMAGIKPQYVEDAVTLALAKSDEEDGLKNVLAEFKVKYPVWFEDNTNDGNNIGQKGTGSTIKTGDKNDNTSGKGLGARLAAQRKSGSNSQQKTYWS